MLLYNLTFLFAVFPLPLYIESAVSPLSFVGYDDHVLNALKPSVVYVPSKLVVVSKVLPELSAFLKSSSIDIAPVLGTGSPLVNNAPRNSDRLIFEPDAMVSPVSLGSVSSLKLTTFHLFLNSEKDIFVDPIVDIYINSFI